MLWTLVRQYLALPSNELKSCALKVLEQSQTLASAQPLSDCVIGVANLLIQHPEPEVDYDRGFKWLLHVATSRFEVFTESAKSTLAELAADLATNESYQADAVTLYEAVIRRDDVLTARVGEEWATTLADDLPLECCASLFRSFAHLSETAKQQVVSYFDSGFTLASPPVRYRDLYLMAAEEIPVGSWKVGELQAHLNKALSAFPSKVSSGTPPLEALLPGLSKIYLHADPATVATCLRDTFATANNYPPQNNVLHQYFAGTWPTTEAIKPGYVPQTIFIDAFNVAKRSPQDAKRGVLRSLESMLSAGIVGAEDERELLEVACLIWQTHPAEAEAFLAHTSGTLTAVQIAALPDAINWETTEEVDWLIGAWSNAVQNLNLSERLVATLQILAKGQFGTNELPDHGLTLWARSLDEHANDVLNQAVLSPEITDEGRRRLWRQIISLSTKPAAKDLINLAVQILPIKSAPETAAAVTSELEKIALQLTDQADRYNIAVLLLKSIPQCSSMTIKANLAQLAHQLGTQAVLQSVDETTLNEDDLQVIAGSFGKGRELTKLQKRFAKL
ncbi:hypothetical protein D3C76_815860 [compost metagenome]